MENGTGRILGIAVRDARGGPMREIERARAMVDGGIEGNAKVSPKRGITLLDRRRWNDALRELNVELPWHTRRANVLVDGLDLSSLIGNRIRFGTVEVEIRGETDPCGVMDDQHPGLRAALEPDCRGGVYGRVIRGGEFAVGDKVTMSSEQKTLDIGL